MPNLHEVTPSEANKAYGIRYSPFVFAGSDNQRVDLNLTVFISGSVEAHLTEAQTRRIK